MTIDVTAERHIKKTVNKYVASDIRKKRHPGPVNRKKSSLQKQMCPVTCDKKNTTIPNG